MPFIFSFFPFFIFHFFHSFFIFIQRILFLSDFFVGKIPGIQEYTGLAKMYFYFFSFIFPFFIFLFSFCFSLYIAILQPKKTLEKLEKMRRRKNENKK
jgi:hypothetical protein